MYHEVNENNKVKSSITVNKTTSLQVKVVSWNISLLLPVIWKKTTQVA